MAKPKVNQDKCIGCGACVSLCSRVFELGDNGKAHVRSGADCSNCDCKRARDSCPVNAITIE